MKFGKTYSYIMYTEISRLSVITQYCISCKLQQKILNTVNFNNHYKQTKTLSSLYVPLDTSSESLSEEKKDQILRMSGGVR